MDSSIVKFVVKVTTARLYRTGNVLTNDRNIYEDVRRNLAEVLRSTERIISTPTLSADGEYLIGPP